MIDLKSVLSPGKLENINDSGPVNKILKYIQSFFL